MSVPGQVQHDKVTTQNGVIVKVEWEQYLGGGDYGMWSIVRSSHLDGDLITVCEGSGPDRAEWRMRAEDARELMLQLKRFFPDWADRRP